MVRGGVVDVILVRHASTAWSEAGRFTGHTDVPLSEGGRAEARALRSSLDLRDDRWTGVWTSDLGRCVETARLSIGEAVSDERLRELDFGDIEGLTWEELDAGTSEALVGFEGFEAPGGESVVALRRRLDDFLKDLVPGRHLVFTHGGPIRALIGSDLAVPPCSIHALLLDNGT